MRLIFPGLGGALLALGLSTLPGALYAQDPKAKDDVRDKIVGFYTSDGLSLNGYWFQGTASDKNPPDAVMMFPAPGNKVNDAWIGLAQELSKKNFSVLLFDWRGCGMNSADAAGTRIFADTKLFWQEPYNQRLLKPQQSYENKGLDYNRIWSKTQGNMRYRDFLFNDLLAARFYLDRQNDNKKCNSGRTWIITEKDGGQMALAFIAAEFPRNSIYDPMGIIGAVGRQFQSAGRDYVGLVTLSFSTGNPSATSVWNSVFRQMGVAPSRDARDHLEHRLAMFLVYGKKEGERGSRVALAMVGARGTADDLKKDYKYLREVDNSKVAKPVSGIDLIGPGDAFGAQKLIIEALPGISKALPGGKDTTDRQANKMTVVPRFPAEALMGRR